MTTFAITMALLFALVFLALVCALGEIASLRSRLEDAKAFVEAERSIAESLGYQLQSLKSSLTEKKE